MNSKNQMTPEQEKQFKNFVFWLVMTTAAGSVALLALVIYLCLS